MLSSIWAFLQDESNRAVLGWIGGGAVVVATGLWTAFRFFASGEKGKSTSGTTISATHGGIAAGRDVNIDKRGGAER